MGPGQDTLNHWGGSCLKAGRFAFGLGFRRDSMRDSGTQGLRDQNCTIKRCAKPMRGPWSCSEHAMRRTHLSVVWFPQRFFLFFARLPAWLPLPVLCPLPGVAALTCFLLAARRGCPYLLLPASQRGCPYLFFARFRPWLPLPLSCPPPGVAALTCSLPASQRGCPHLFFAPVAALTCSLLASRLPYLFLARLSAWLPLPLFCPPPSVAALTCFLLASRRSCPYPFFARLPAWLPLPVFCPRPGVAALTCSLPASRRGCPHLFFAPVAALTCSLFASRLPYLFFARLSAWLPLPVFCSPPGCLTWFFLVSRRSCPCLFLPASRRGCPYLFFAPLPA